MVWIAIIGGLALLVLYPKRTLAICGVLAALAAGALAIFFYVTTKGDSERQADEKLVTISAAFDPASPYPGFPLRVTVINGSSKSVREVVFYLEAFVPGHSSNHAGYDSFKVDNILKPGEQVIQYVRLPSGGDDTPASAMNWQAVRPMIIFEN